MEKKADIDITCLPVNMSNTEFKCFCFFPLHKDVHQVAQRVISLFSP